MRARCDRANEPRARMRGKVRARVGDRECTKEREEKWTWRARLVLGRGCRKGSKTDAMLLVRNLYYTRVKVQEPGTEGAHCIPLGEEPSLPWQN